MTEQDRADLADLALKALDQILEEYGDDAKLMGATLIYEVETVDEDGDTVYHGNYRSLERCTASHVGGMAQTLANHLMNP